MSYKVVEKVHRDPFCMVHIQQVVSLEKRGVKAIKSINGYGFTRRNSSDCPTEAIAEAYATARAEDDMKRLRAEFKMKFNKRVDAIEKQRKIELEAKIALEQELIRAKRIEKERAKWSKRQAKRSGITQNELQIAQ